ncbi:hypothetical protein LX36DRAFT_657413 [Colletotrichum falcatum]|nr:hypothetical protein LX36DRAFT_657413 [Colletotrichum falcatum]
MHALTVLFASLSAMAGLAAGQGVPAGGICCTDVINDPTKTCSGSAFCCDTGTNSDVGRGCDDNKDFPIGRTFSGVASASCKSGTSTGTITCG